MKYAVSFVVLACLASCDAKPDTPLVISEPSEPSAPALKQDSTVRTAPPRISVERVGVFEDGLAFAGRRGIYVIRDAKTGQEFIGISGVGISETGSHQAGKTSVTDER